MGSTSRKGCKGLFSGNPSDGNRDWKAGFPQNFSHFSLSQAQSILTVFSVTFEKPLSQASPFWNVISCSTQYRPSSRITRQIRKSQHRRVRGLLGDRPGPRDWGDRRVGTGPRVGGGIVGQHCGHPGTSKPSGRPSDLTQWDAPNPPTTTT